jgi:hypothetical protein
MGELVHTQSLSPDIIESLVIDGDLGKMSAMQRVEYYVHRCRVLGLDPGEQPFEVINLNGKIRLYATKAGANALTRVNKLSVEIRSTTIDGSLVTVCARASDPSGRFADDVGVLDIDEESKGRMKMSRSNAMMKAVTKAKRRAVLALVGLGVLDESEVDDVRGARSMRIDVVTGEIDTAPEPAGAIDTTAAPTAPPRTREQKAADQLADLHADIAGRVNDIAAIMRADKSSVYCGAVKAAGLARGTSIESLDHMASVAVLERLYVKLAALRGEQAPDPAAELDAALTCTELYERLCAADPADYEPGNYKREWANMLALDEWPANPTPAHLGEVAEHITRILEKLSE